MKKFGMILGGIVVLLIVAALVAPFFIDLNSYKALIAEKAKEATGRDLTIDGDISLSLLPTPSVSVEGLKFGNAPGGTAPNMAELESIKVKVALMPLFSGKAKIESIILTRPVIVLEKLADGKGNWEIAPAAVDGAAPAEPAATEVGGSGGFDLAVDSASIEDGTLIYRDLGAGTEQKVENLNVDLALGSLQGPFEAKGGLKTFGMPLGFALKLGKLDAAQPMPIEINLTIEDAKAELGFSGQADMAAANDPAKPIVTGMLTGKGESVAKLRSVLAGVDEKAQPPAFAQSFSISGSITAGKSEAAVKDLAFTLGDVSGKGDVAAKFGATTEADANLNIVRIDLDKLLPPADGAAAAQADAATDQAAPAAAGQPAGFTLPQGVTANLNVDVAQIAYQGKSIDATKLIAQLKDGQVEISQLSARLPGNTAFTLSGILEARDGQPNFTGAVKATSDNLRELIDTFAKGAVAGVPGDRLRKLGLTTRLNYSPTQVELADIAAQLDSSRVSGGVIVALPDGVKRKRMAFGVGLSVDKLNVDGYMPASKAAESGAAATQSADTKKARDNPLKALAPLGDLDANVELKAGSLTLNQQQINGLHVLVGLKDGTLDIKDLSVKDLMGGKGAVSGKVTDLKGNPKFDTAFDITAKDAGRVLQMAGMGAQPPGKFGALSLKGSAAGGGDDVSYDVAMSMAGVGLNGTAKGGAAGLLSGGIPRINSTFDIKAKDVASLVALTGGPVDAAKQLGAVAFAGTAQSGSDDLTYDVNLTIGGVGGTGKLSGKVTGISSTPQVDTVLNLQASKPAPILQLAGLAGPKAKAMGALSVAGTLKGGADDMNLDLNLTGIGGTAKVAGNIKASAVPMAFDLTVQANHPEFTQLLAMADLPSSGAKAGPLAVSAKASGTTMKAKVSQLDAKWGDSSIGGTADYDASSGRPYIQANLAGGTVNLVPFMAPAPKKASSGGAATSKGGGGSPWSEEPLDLSALDKQDADIDFKAGSLIMPDQRIDNLEAKIKLKDGLLTLNTLTGQIYGGGFNLSGTTVNGRGTPTLDAKVAINQLQMSELLGGGIAGSQIKGPLSLNLAAAGSGGSQAALVRSLAGRGDLNGTILIVGKVEQQVGSALLGVLGQKVKAIQGVTQTINGVVSSFTGVDNQVSGTFNIAQGVLDTQDTAFVNPRARGTAKGQVDLGAWALRMLIDLFGADAQQAFMSINLTGPVDSPTPAFSGSGAAGVASGLGVPGLNIPGLGGTAGSAVGGALGTIPGLENVPGLGGVLGGQTPAPADTSAPAGVQLPGGVQIPGVQIPGVQIPGLGTGGASQPAASGAAVPLEPGAAGVTPQAAPVETAPAAAAPVEAAPVEAAPAVEPGAAPAPAEAAPAEAAPVEVAPMEAAPAEAAPAAEPGAAPTPVEAAPVEVAPAAPVEIAPAAPVEVAPAAPVEPAAPLIVPEEPVAEPGASGN